VSAADLDALDRGLLAVGQTADEAMSRVVALEAAVADLAKRVDVMTSVEAIMRRADTPQPVLAAAERKATRRTRHLKAIEGGQQ
jgi:hypothetical protein